MTPKFIYADGKWFDSEEEYQDYLEMRYLENKEDGDECDYDHLFER
jgi:hypothetical protein